VEQFKEAFAIYHDMPVNEEYDRPLVPVVCAVRDFVGLESFKAVSARLFSLVDILYANETKILEQGAFPNSWAEKAATLSLTQLGKFSPEDFVWPTEVNS
jgi:hypothetical protein